VVSLAFLAASLIAWRYRRARRQIEETDAEQEILRRSEGRFRPLVQNSSDVFAITDQQGLLAFVSPSLEAMLGIRPDEMLGRSPREYAHPDDVAAVDAMVADVRSRPNYTASAELRVLDKWDREHHVELFLTNLFNDPDVGGIVLNMRDVTQRKELEQQLRHQAFYDSLTSLSNRVLFMDRLGQSLLRARRDGSKKISVLYMDLDYFKNVNDELGHSAGDAVLKQVAARVLACIRTGDTAARLGGDEFAILLDDGESAKEVHAIAERLVAEMSQPFSLGQADVTLSASIGIVLVDPMTMSAEEVVRNADLAMYDAKENGRSRAETYEPGMHTSLVERMQLINELNAALCHDELVVYYQPTVSLDDESITGFEALVRWDHPTRGLLPPSVFIPLAEETGAVVALGEIVLSKACNQMVEWREMIHATRALTMSVNVSAKQVQRPGFVQAVARALQESGLEPHQLVLEITETLLISQPQRAEEALREIQAMGVQIALDDFGTGYSSLSYLKQFPIDILKIDRMFVEGMDSSERERFLAQSVIDLGHMLNLKIVAEGIERKDQLIRLKDLNCAMGQGYLFARPLSAPAAESLLWKQFPSPAPVWKQEAAA
jgi:diguanylate cyclase (GGDEF)-like protein/PAS domain S-box-containing protein